MVFFDCDSSRQISFNLDFFNNYAHNHIETTKVDWHYDQSQSNVIAKFTFGTRKVCDKHSGTNKTLAALYPHQWRRTNKQTLKYHYNSIRGMMKLAEGNSFEVNYEYPGVLPCLPLEVKNIKDELLDITNSKKMLKIHIGQVKNLETYQAPL